MYQADRGQYRKKESMGSMFMNSCLGRLVILAGFVLILLLLASITVPSEVKMRNEMTDNIHQCIEDNKDLNADELDDFIHNVSYIFTDADSRTEAEIMQVFHKLNVLEYYKHTFFSSMHVRNNLHPEGVRVGVGVFGVVVPTVKYHDLLLNLGPMQKEYDNGVIKNSSPIPEELGENPHLTPFHYNGDPEN